MQHIIKKVVKIGSSKGFIIPKALLEEYQSKGHLHIILMRSKD